MLQTLLIVVVIYITILVLLSNAARKGEKSSKNYLLAGSDLGSVLGLFTFAATLFSTFTLLGMPDFFRTHGVGAWIFLMISDAVMVFGVLWIGSAFRKKVEGTDYYGMAGFMRKQYGSNLAGITAFLGASIFLIPYVAIQIRGVADFLFAAFPSSVPMAVWAIGIVVVMIIYSEVGGLKAIIYSDVLQGILLLIAIWIIGYKCLDHFGGLEAMFNQVEEKNAALLSTPGPKGLFDFQFLLGSMIAITLLPFTQPQVSTRLVIMRDNAALRRMAVGLGIFAFLIILPTLFMGMYGAILHPGASAPEFWKETYVSNQPNILAAIVMIGLIAAAISTSDSQLFALGGEVRSLLKGEDKKMLNITRISIAGFATLALIFSLLSSNQLVSLARTSFAGTALLAPMIFVGIFANKPGRFQFLPLLTLVALFVFIASLLGLIPNKIVGIRMDLFLLGILTVVGLLAAGNFRPSRDG